MNRALFLGVLILLAGTAGCFGGDDDQARDRPSPPDEDGDQGGGDQQTGREDGGTDRTDDDRQGPPPPFLLQGERCRDARLEVPVDAEQARALIPEGFSLEPYRQETPVALPIEQAALRVLTIRCPVGGLSQGGPGWTLHLLALHVQPPEEHRGAQSLSELYVIEAVASETSVATVFQDRGWAVADGTANLTLTGSPTGFTAFESQAEGGEVANRMQGSTSGPNETRTSGFVRYWHDPAERLEYLHLALTSFHEARNATGLIQPQDPGSRTGQLLGPATSGTGGLVGPYSLLATPTLIRAAG